MIAALVVSLAVLYVVIVHVAARRMPPAELLAAYALCLALATVPGLYYSAAILLVCGAFLLGRAP